MTGQTLGHFRMEERLGAGGMGVVYRAWDLRLERTVALKLLGESMPVDEDARKRLLREARTASALNHPHICTIYEVGEAGGHAYIAMEYVEGRPLSALVPSEGLTVETVVRYGAQMADALAHAHQRGVVHRDLKSANVVITPEGRAKVLDFGLARRLPQGQEAEQATRSQMSQEVGGIAGTLHYMAPELLRGQPADPLSDLWAMGVMLHEMATGALPFQGKTGFELSSAILREPPAALPPQVPASLRAVIQRCLAKEPGERYQRAGEVRAALEAIQSGIGVSGTGILAGQAAAPAPLAPSASPWKRRAILAVSGVLLALVILLLGLNVGGWRKRLGGGAAPRIESLAVLPLENLSGDPSQDYFADGITEALIGRLGQAGPLRVISRTSVMRYKGARKPLPEIARELKVDAVVEGSVLRSGDRVRVTAQLIEAATDRHLWADQFDRETKDIFALQDDISRSIVTALRLTLRSAEPRPAAAQATKNLEAYDAYLRGVFHSTSLGAQENEVAIAMFERATALDPQFALAQAALAGVYIGKFFNWDPSKAWEEKAFVAIDKALSLDPNLAEAYLARGNLAWTLANHFPHERAIKDLRHALAINPNLAEAHFALGSIYLHIGLLEKALDELNTAVAIDPHNLNALYRIPRVYLYQQRYQEAWAAFERSPEFARDWQKPLVLWYLGRKSEALALVEKLRADSPGSEDVASAYAVLLAASGQNKKAEEQVRTAIERGQGRSHFHHAEYNIASAYALMGRRREALDWLQKTADDGLPCYPLFEKDPHLNGLRSDPQFAALLSKMKSQWEQFRATL